MISSFELKSIIYIFLEISINSFGDNKPIVKPPKSLLAYVNKDIFF